MINPARAGGALLKRAIKQAAMRLMRGVLRRPQLKLLARRLLARFPALQGRLQTMMYRSALTPPAKWPRRVQPEGDLSPRTLRMVRALKHAIKEQGR